MNNKRLLNKPINASIIKYKGEERIALQFGYDEKLIEFIKKLPDRKYSGHLKLWHIPNTVNGQQALRASGLAVQWKKTESHNQALNQELELPRKLLNRIDSYHDYLKRQRYSTSTCNSYVMIITTFFVWYQKNGMTELNESVLHHFNDDYLVKGGYSRSYQNLWVSALKLFVEKFDDVDVDFTQIERPRKSYNLPNVLSENEVRQLIDSYRNIKHKAIIMTIYACGLRKSELLNLRIRDIDSDRMIIRIRNSKGAKDRDIPLPVSLLEVLRNYYLKYRPREYVIEGYHGSRYSASSIDKILRQGLERIGKPRKITCHGLRHSYATHLVEHNINLRYIQESLGHKSSKTTEIYTVLSKEHIANMVSPIDFWNNRDKYKTE